MNIREQVREMKQIWPKFAVEYTRRHVVWKGPMVSTLTGQTFQVQISYPVDQTVQVKILDPPLQVLDQGQPIPHVYPNLSLCLFYPANREWNPLMSISRTIVPWTYEWLFFYEVWRRTGIWEGGGIEHKRVKRSYAEKKSPY